MLQLKGWNHYLCLINIQQHVPFFSARQHIIQYGSHKHESEVIEEYVSSVA